ncbi:MAG TPA: LysM peptidoglycan-binding domain-containing protein [Xanthobacteraceae bacterium]|jgi:LysM repeat protein
MVRRKHIAVVLFAALLSACASSAMFDQDMTASVTASADSARRPAAAAKNPGDNLDPPPAISAPATAPAVTASAAAAATTTPAGRPAQPAVPPAVKPVVLASTASATAPLTPRAAAEAAKIESRGRAYLFRGFAGIIFSTGMDRLAERINHIGMKATVDAYLMWRTVADEAIRDYRRDPQPIILIGHSLGADDALAFAERLNAVDIPVSLLVTYDPSTTADNVPANVERYINIYQAHGLVGGGNVVQARGFHGQFASYNLTEHSEIIHINIEKAERIQEQLVAKIAQLAVTPANDEGEGLPIHIVVPRDAPIELWDSGMTVFAHSGDTLKTIAATYRVPLWSLAQLNQVSDRTVLADRQRLIVPRHLVAMPTAVSSYAPSAR